MSDDTRFHEHILDISFQYAYGIGIGDFNNDGRNDISVADAIEGTFSLLEQQEDDHFMKNIIAQDNGWYERHKIINNQGQFEFWVVKNRSGEVVRLSKKNDQWIEDNIVTEVAPFDIAIKDINEDGVPDFALSTHNQGKVVQYTSTNEGYKRQVLSEGLSYVKTIDLADLNKDGTNDTISSSGGLKSFFYIDGKTGKKYDIGNNLHNPMVGTIADIDNNGDLDALIATGGNIMPADTCETGVYWFENIDKGKTWTKHPIHQGNKTGFEVIANDLDNDGDLDLIASYYEDPAMIIWYENNLPDKWKGHMLKSSYSIEGANQILVADMNNDGHKDIISAWADRDSRVIIFYQKP